MVQWVAVPSTYTDDVDNFVRNQMNRFRWDNVGCFFVVETRFKNS
jgi:hypothetical protein